MVPLILVAGLVAQMLAWRLVARGRDVWRTLPPLLAVMGVVALLVGRTLPRPDPAGSSVPGAAGVLVIGAATGILLFLATRVFVAIAIHVPAFARQTEAAYGRTAGTDRGRELLFTLALAVPGEELFWRGLAYRWGAAELRSAVAAAVLVWLAYVVGNVASRSLPIVAGALVGGALWGALAWWSGGVLAPLASHILWTGSMLVFPPTVSAPHPVTKDDG